MITLEYFNGSAWTFVDENQSEFLLWVMLGEDNFNYRTVDVDGKILTDNSHP